MKNFIGAITISLIIHFLLFYNFKTIDSNIQPMKQQINKSSNHTYIKLVSIKKDKPIEKLKKQNKKEIITKPKLKKKIIKKKISKTKVKEIVKKPKPKTKINTKKIDNLKDINDKRDSFLQYDEIQAIQQLDPITKSYLKLYGSEYFELSSKVKKYLKENINEIGRITQQYLRYPSIAIRTKQQGTNILEFTLKANGDIVNLKIIGSSTYSTLDRNSIKTIKIAYKDYPKPKEDSLIRIYINYLLY